MRQKITVVLTVTLALGLLLAQSAAPLVYPRAKKGTRVDNYHGKQIADPYRQLEDTSNPDTRAWIDAEVKLTESWLAGVPQRAAIGNRLTRLYDYEKYPGSTGWGYTGAFSAGKHYFLLRNSGLQNQAVLYTVDAAGNTPQVLLDPNSLRANGTAALCGLSPSHDGGLLAYGTALSGSDWCEWHIRNVDTRKDLPDLIRWTKATWPVWTPRNDAFYYVRYPQPAEGKLLTALNRDPRVMLHRVGQPEARDELVYENPKRPDDGLSPALTADGRYLLLVAYPPEDILKNVVYYEDVSTPNPRMAQLTNPPAGLYNYLGSRGSTVYFETTNAAEKGRIIAVDLQKPDRANWKQVIAEQPDNMDKAVFAGNKFLVSFLKDAHGEAKLYSAEGAPLSTVALEGLGTLDWSSAEQDATELFYSFAGFTAPPSLYKLDLRTAKSTLVRRSKLNFDSGNYETKQVFYRSKDGTRVPMFLVHKRGLRLDGNNPVLLYGYGGFDSAVTPSFSPPLIAWMDMGGVFASANLRGGSEYGEAWHLAGAKHQKQHVFDDFIAAAEWLVANKYTSTPRLAIYGRSNGGLLVGAVLNQRPDLFGAALPEVGVMDMLRFHKFTAGSYWMGEYGSPDNAEDFKTILAYSPLHNIRKGAKYPPTLIATSDHDDRVVPGHSFKYAATLQEAQAGPAPILIRIQTDAGHGAGTPTSKTIGEWRDRLAFLVKIMNLHPALDAQQTGGR